MLSRYMRMVRRITDTNDEDEEHGSPNDTDSEDEVVDNDGDNNADHTNEDYK